MTNLEQAVEETKKMMKILDTRLAIHQTATKFGVTTSDIARQLGKRARRKSIIIHHQELSEA